MTFGELMRLERKKAKLSQTQLAERLGVTQSLIGQYERGELNPKLDTIKRICAALGIEYLPTIQEQEQNAIPHNITEARERTGCTQERLANLTGYSLTTIKRLESGEIEITEDHLDRIARALGMRPNQLNDLTSIPAPSGLDTEIRFQRFNNAPRYEREIQRKAATVIAFEDLNENGQMCAIDLLKLVSKVPEYQRNKD